jgi:hypothetical protein
MHAGTAIRRHAAVSNQRVASLRELDAVLGVAPDVAPLDEPASGF